MRRGTVGGVELEPPTKRQDRRCSSRISLWPQCRCASRKTSRPHPVLHVRQIHEHRLQRGPECKCDHSYSHSVVPPQPCKAQGQLTNPSSRHRRPLLTTCCRTPSVLGP
eukprot:scaffold43158_cov54-Phaeocystis_antarctica.AAC.2